MGQGPKLPSRRQRAVIFWPVNDLASRGPAQTPGRGARTPRAVATGGVRRQGEVGMTAPIEVTKGQAEAHPEDLLRGVDGKAIQGRSLGQIAWMRLKRDKA